MAVVNLQECHGLAAAIAEALENGAATLEHMGMVVAAEMSKDRSVPGRVLIGRILADPGAHKEEVLAVLAALEDKGYAIMGDPLVLIGVIAKAMK